MALIKCSNTFCKRMNDDTKEKCSCGTSIKAKVEQEQHHMGIDRNTDEILQYIYDTKNQRYCLNVISNYEIINNKKSGSSLAKRAGLGLVVLGPVGLLAGATAKNNVQVLINYKNKNKDLVLLNEENFKKLLENI